MWLVEAAARRPPVKLLVVRLELDRDACTGHAICRDICPTVFAIGDDGLAVLLVDNIEPELESAVDEAVLACPDLAIRWIEQ